MDTPFPKKRSNKKIYIYLLLAPLTRYIGCINNDPYTKVMFVTLPTGQRYSETCARVCFAAGRKYAG